MKSSLARPFCYSEFNSLPLNSLFYYPDSDQFKGEDGDWELVELLDQDIARKVDGNEDEMLDSVDLESSHSTVFCLGSNHKIKYRILSKDDVRQLLADRVSNVSTVLSLSQSEVVTLLQHFNWNIDRAQDEWLSREEEVRRAVGLFESKVVETSDSDENTCRGCGGTFGADNRLAISCGHEMCLCCWTGYTSEAINSGPECLALRCPYAPCEAAVGHGLIELVSNQDDKNTFDTFLLKSFIIGSKKGKWCPASGCVYAICANDSRNVTCQCLHSFCMDCLEEGHEPVDCVAVDIWKSEIVVQSNNWLLSYTRSCPSCERRVEESSCQNNSQCTVCCYTFCNDQNGVSAKSYDDNDWMKEFARSSLEIFQPCYDGYVKSETSIQNALANLKVLKEISLPILYVCLDQNESELGFITEAHVQVVHCWRLLKWMYVYSFFLSQDEPSKKNLLDFMLDQGVRLVKMLEKHADELVQGVLKEEILPPYHMAYRGKLAQLTRVIRRYFDTVVEDVSSGPSEVVGISSPRRLKTEEASRSYKTEDVSCSYSIWSPSWSPRPEDGEPTAISPSSSPSRKLMKLEGEGVSSSPASNSSPICQVIGGFDGEGVSSSPTVVSEQSEAVFIGPLPQAESCQAGIKPEKQD